MLTCLRKKSHSHTLLATPSYKRCCLSACLCSFFTPPLLRFACLCSTLAAVPFVLLPLLLPFSTFLLLFYSTLAAFAAPLIARSHSRSPTLIQKERGSRRMQTTGKSRNRIGQLTTKPNKTQSATKTKQSATSLPTSASTALPSTFQAAKHPPKIQQHTMEHTLEVCPCVCVHVCVCACVCMFVPVGHHLGRRCLLQLELLQPPSANVDVNANVDCDCDCGPVAQSYYNGFISSYTHTQREGEREGNM